MTFELLGNQVRLDGRRIGWVSRLQNGKKVFISPRKRGPHYFRIYRGFGIAKDVLDFLQRNLFDEIHLRFGKRETLVSSLENWFAHAIPYHKKGFEPQLILPKKYMEKKMLSLSEIME